MWRRADLGSVLRRVDVRLALGLAASIGLLLLGLVSLLFVVATHETAELLEEGLAEDLESISTRDLESAATDPEALVAVRRFDASGEIELLQGRWPRSGALIPAGTSPLVLAFAAPQDHLVLERPGSDGATLQAATSLSGFVAERKEQIAQILVSLAVSLVGLAVVTVTATRLALAPIRAATRAVEQVDEHHLDQRIPVRGASDDLDRHAEALNRVLARLEEAFLNMAVLSADVAHELRTPVNRMLNLADLAILRTGTSSAAPELSAVREAADGMGHLIDDLLLLTKGDWGRIAARHEPVALSPLVGGIASLFRPSFEEKKVALLVHDDPDDDATSGDPDLLQRAVSNLLDNALRHTPPGGRVELSSTHPGPVRVLEVSDSGSGIPEADRERIFDRFVQLDAARADEGTGLGLALVRMIARAHGGEVSVGTSDLGGARFRITLPESAPAPAEGHPGARDRLTSSGAARA
jgi:signal transduction histidine kinase